MHYVLCVVRCCLLVLVGRALLGSHFAVYMSLLYCSSFIMYCFCVLACFVCVFGVWRCVFVSCGCLSCVVCTFGDCYVLLVVGCLMLVVVVSCL